MHFSPPQVEPLKVAINGKYDAYEDEWRKPNINAKNKKGQIALHLAVCNARGEIEPMQVLLEAGADPNARDSYDETALHVAARMCDHAHLKSEAFAPHALASANPYAMNMISPMSA